MFVIDLENDYYIVQFSKEEDYMFALQEGPCIILDHYLVVQRWRSEFDPCTDNFSKVAVWISIKSLPVEYVNPTCLWRLGNVVGRSLKVDIYTLNLIGEQLRVERGRFARVCIEIDLRKSLLAKVRCGRKMYVVEYEGLGLICFGCGRYGHRKDECSLGKKP